MKAFKHGCMDRVLLGMVCAFQLITKAAAEVDLGAVEVSSFSHAFRQGPYGMPNLVAEFLIDQNSGVPAVLPNVSANFDLNNQFTLRITAPPGQKFRVTVPLGQELSLHATLGWKDVSVSPSPVGYGTTSVSFGGFEGPLPAFTQAQAQLTQSHESFGLSTILSAPLAGDIMFSSITLTATVSPAYIGSGVLNYTPDSMSYLGFFYYTPAGSDPGGFASIVPEPSTSLLVLSAIFPIIARTLKRSAS